MSGRGSGRIRLFVGNRGSGRVNVLPGRVQEKWPVDNSRGSSELFKICWQMKFEVAKLVYTLLTLTSIDQSLWLIWNKIAHNMVHFEPTPIPLAHIFLRAQTKKMQCLPLYQLYFCYIFITMTDNIDDACQGEMKKMYKGIFMNGTNKESFNVPNRHSWTSTFDLPTGRLIVSPINISKSRAGTVRLPQLTRPLYGTPVPSKGRVGSWATPHATGGPNYCVLFRRSGSPTVGPPRSRPPLQVQVKGSDGPQMFR